jgi:hypothetical protein
MKSKTTSKNIPATGLRVKTQVKAGGGTSGAHVIP